MRSQPRLIRASIAFLLAFGIAVLTFVLVTDYQIRLAGGMSMVAEPERTRQFLFLLPIIASVVAAFCILPALIVGLIAQRVATILNLSHVSYFIVCGSLVGLVSFSIAHWATSVIGPGDELAGRDYARVLTTLTDALASGGLGGLIYWIIAYSIAPRTEEVSSEPRTGPA